MKYKGILLDLDHTLYDYNKAHGPAMEEVFSWVINYSKKSESQVKEAFVLARKQTHENLKNTAASHNRLLYFQNLLERLGVNPLEGAKLAYEVYWGCFLEKMVFRAGASEFLQNYQGEVCLLTDLTAHIQYRKIAHLGLANVINHLVTSEEVGIEKPDTRMFTAAMRKLQLKPQEVCMIGDNYKKDCLGAAALGIKSYWFDDGKTTQADHPLITHFTNFSTLSEEL